MITDILRYCLDTAYSKAGMLGLHPYQVFISRKLNGTKTETQILLRDSYNPQVRQVSAKDVILSNGQLSDKDRCIGPLPKNYTSNSGGGTLYTTVSNTVAGEQLYFRLVGDGDQDGGSYYSLLYIVEDSALSFSIYCRKSGIKGF